MRASCRLSAVLLIAGELLLGGCSRVSNDWKAAQAADTTEAYQDFLQQHGDSEFGVQAQERIKQLAEDRDWRQASVLDTRDAYEQFVAQHADGKWAQEARVRIENFQLAAESPGKGTAVSAVAPAAVPAAAASKTAAAGYYAQLGAFSSRAAAESEWLRLSKKFKSQLGSFKPHYSAGKSQAKTVYRLQIPVGSEQRARDVCAALKKQSQACVPVAG